MLPTDNEYDIGLNERYEFRMGHQDAMNPSSGERFNGVPIDREPYNRTSTITKVDGVSAYSQLASLYKGVSNHQQFWPQPGLNVDTGKMPRGGLNEEPRRYNVPRNKMGFLPQGPYNKESNVPLVSPLPSLKEDSTTWDEAHHTTVRDLRHLLNRGMGSRTNKYLLELDIPIWDSPDIRTLNILCQSASFPTRQQHTASVWRFGRKYNLRGETNFGDTCTLEFVDDSAMTIRRALDRWFMDIDDSKLQDEGLNGLYDPIKTKLNDVIINREQNKKLDWSNAAKAYNSGFSKEYNTSLPGYQTDVRVFQLDQVGNKVMGYLFQNAFISEIQQIEYADSKENELTKFSITLTFSEFISLSEDNNTIFQRILG